MSKDRKGCLYSEMTNKGRCSTRYVRGAKPVYCFRWVAEIHVNGKRYRFRSTSYNNCCAWLNDMIEKSRDILMVTGGAAHKKDLNKEAVSQTITDAIKM